MTVQVQIDSGVKNVVSYTFQLIVSSFIFVSVLFTKNHNIENIQDKKTVLRRGGFNPNYRRRVRNFEGKITYAKKDDTEGSREQISLYEEDSSHCIVSPRYLLSFYSSSIVFLI